MTHASLESGIGGFDLAAEWMGWQNIFHCEIDPFCLRVLTQYWPKAITYRDIRKTDFTPHYGTIDVLTCGFPCQPYSTAGKRKGKYDERHLWPENYRAIREIGPSWVVGENVRGLISWNDGMVFDEVQSDLEAAGYEVFPVVLPAAGVNAPHRRYRILFIAYSAQQSRRKRANQIDAIAESRQTWAVPSSVSGRGITTNAIRTRLEEQPRVTGNYGAQQSAFERDSNRWGGGGLLNPRFVEEMMGFPIGWTELKP